MHELSITQSIVNIAAETAAKHQVKRVNEIRIRIGEYSGIVPQCVQQYFDILSKGTAAEGAVLKMGAESRLPCAARRAGRRMRSTSGTFAVPPAEALS